VLDWMKGLAAVAMIATLITAVPAASTAALADSELDPNDWEAPIVIDRDPAVPSLQGLFDEDPTDLVPKTPFVQRYSLDQDHWEVWLCGSVSSAMPDVLDDLRDASVGYFDAISGGVYEPVFTAGGTKPTDAYCLSKFDDGTYSTVGTPEGILIIDSVTSSGGYASPGVICLNDQPDCSGISSTYPGNRRYAVLGEPALVGFPSITVHELGHTLQWPHSNSGAAEYDNWIDLMSGNRTTGGSTERDPYSTLSYNRFQSGWVSPADVVVADGSYQAATVEPFNVAGTQLFVIKTAQAGRFYVFGTRTTSAYDPIPTAWQGVEVYEVDHYCGESFPDGICPGIFRDQTQEPPSPNQVLHVLNPGESIVLEGLTVFVTGATVTGYNLTSDPDPGVVKVPSAPGIPRAEAAAGQAAIRWNTAGDGGSLILNYDLEVEDRDGGGSTVTNVGVTLSEVVTSLSNGTTYRARVRATNATGDGPWSAWSSDFQPRAVPSVPGIPVVIAGNAQIAASWSEPADSGGFPVTNYELEVNDQTSGSTSSLDVGATPSKALIGLANGHQYRIRVRAENVVGTGVWSGWSTSVTPATMPSAPGSPTITVTSATSATASWSVPTSNGGLNLVGYQVDLENLTTAGLVTLNPGLVTTLALDGLTTGDTYRFRVRADNGLGWSDWSAWSPDFIPGTVPSAPGVPVVAAGDGEISASWNAAGGIGFAVDSYELVLDNITSTTSTTVDVAAVLAHTFTGVANGDDYRVRARAHNDSGWGPWSGWSNTVTPVAPPAPPNTFIDDDGSVFEADIEWLAAQGITRGCNPPTNDRFCPGNAVTRRQMAAFLVRALGLADDGAGNTFVDDDGSVFEADIAKLAAAGITLGCNPPANDRFCPSMPLTRGQMAAFLVRALGLTDDGGGNGFVDDDGSVFEADIAKLAAAGITQGCNPPANDRFCPESAVTRGQMAAFLHRALG
jgi:hypothetical protein